MLWESSQNQFGRPKKKFDEVFIFFFENPSPEMILREKQQKKKTKTNANKEIFPTFSGLNKKN